jgi:hypothetical protein
MSDAASKAEFSGERRGLVRPQKAYDGGGNQDPTWKTPDAGKYSSLLYE